MDFIILLPTTSLHLAISRQRSISVSISFASGVERAACPRDQFWMDSNCLLTLACLKMVNCGPEGLRCRIATSEIGTNKFCRQIWVVVRDRAVRVREFDKRIHAAALHILFLVPLE
eukprot:scaffold594192_cov31-Prasinocladus_malaysianus.AAC.1